MALRQPLTDSTEHRISSRCATKLNRSANVVASLHSVTDEIEVKAVETIGDFPGIGYYKCPDSVNRLFFDWAR